jgi:hypothetical protein
VSEIKTTKEFLLTDDNGNGFALIQDTNDDDSVTVVAVSHTTREIMFTVQVDILASILKEWLESVE